MAGLGNGTLDPEGQGADGLDCLENLSFTNFTPAIGCILGDEYGDGQFRSFLRTNVSAGFPQGISNLALNIGQGVFRLNAGLRDVPGALVQQFNRSPQTNGAGMPYNFEQNADIAYIRSSDAFGPGEGLTDKQAAALAAAIEIGYFDTPRRASSEDLAAKLGVSPSTAVEHLRKAEKKVLENYLHPV
jgi:hypothetical protein